MMIHFRNDYSDIAHPTILKRFVELQNETHLGYGMDTHVERAKACLKQAIGFDGYIHLMTGGTSANKTVIAHLLKPYEERLFQLKQVILKFMKREPLKRQVIRLSVYPLKTGN
jgi:threonine aldolase